MRSNEGKLIYIYERVTIINNLETNYVESIIKEVRKTAEEIFNKHIKDQLAEGQTASSHDRFPFYCCGS